MGLKSDQILVGESQALSPTALSLGAGEIPFQLKEFVSALVLTFLLWCAECLLVTQALVHM